MDWFPIILIAVVIAIAALVVLLVAKQYRKVGPNEVLIISGGKKRTLTDRDGTARRIGYRIHIGGGTFVLPFIEQAQTLSLELVTLELSTPEVVTARGIPLMTESTAQVSIPGDEESIRRAAEQFLGAGPEKVRTVALQSLEGHVRAALGKMTVEEIYQNRDAFAAQVMETSRAEFSKLGLELLSFSLKEIRDTQGYLEALGKPEVARVKRDAIVAEAETERDAVIKAAEATKEGDVAKLSAQSEVAAANRDYELKRAEFQTAVNEKKAQADMAYELERVKENRKLREAELSVQLVEKEKSIEIEDKEIARREKELEATVLKPSEARKQQIQAEAEAERYRLEEEARGQAEADKILGQVKLEMARLKAVGEAEGMLKKAGAWKEYNQAAVFDQIIKTLPELARAVSEPLSKVDKIVMVSGDGTGTGISKITGDVAGALAQLPTVVESLSGVDLKKLLKRLPQIEDMDSE